jgi:DNA-directed RNA polymerase subunit alpha
MVGELVKRTESDLMAIRNFGRKSLQEVKDKLATMGLELSSEQAAAEESGENAEGEAPA